MVFAFNTAAYSGTETTDLVVTATAVQVCSVTTDPIAFGFYGGSEKIAKGAVKVSCTRDTLPKIGLNEGLNYDGGEKIRQMKKLAGTGPHSHHQR